MNNITFDLSTLQPLGLPLTDTQMNELVVVLNKVLEDRVNNAILELLTKEQADELLALSNEGNEEKIGEWIINHVPDFKEVYQDEYDILLGDVVKDPMQFLQGQSGASVQ